MPETIMTVMVWDKPYDITVHKRSMTLWTATGTYMGQEIHVQSSGRAEVATLWQQTARAKGKG